MGTEFLRLSLLELFLDAWDSVDIEQIELCFNFVECVPKDSVDS